MLLLTSLTRFNSLRTLSFLVLFPATWTIHLYFSQATCPCFYPLKAFFLCLTLFRNNLLIHTGFLVFLHFCWDASLSSLQEVILEYYPDFLGPSLLLGFVLCHSLEQILEETKACSPEVQGGELAVCSPHSPEDLAFHHFITPLHVPHQPLIVVRSRFSLGCLCRLEKKNNSSMASKYQELPGLQGTCCVVPSRDTRVLESPHEHQGL